MVVWVFDHRRMWEPSRRQTPPDVDRRVSLHPAKSVSTKISKGPGPPGKLMDEPQLTRNESADPLELLLRVPIRDCELAAELPGRESNVRSILAQVIRPR